MVVVVAHFDRWGRYLIVPAAGGAPNAHTRVTTWASTLDDRYGLEQWSRRTVALGLARRPDLLAQAAVAQADESDTLNGLCEAALEAGGLRPRRTSAPRWTSFPSGWTSARMSWYPRRGPPT